MAGVTLAALSRDSNVITQAATIRKPRRDTSRIKTHNGTETQLFTAPPMPMTTGPAKLKLFNLKLSSLSIPGPNMYCTIV